MRPSGPNDLLHASGLYCDLGSMSVSRYACSDEMRREVVDESSDAHCFKASLSEQDFDRVGGASPRASPNSVENSYEKSDESDIHGFRLTTPS